MLTWRQVLTRRHAISLPPYHRDKLVEPDGAIKPYVTIGEGAVPLVVVPGSADGLRTAFDVAPYLAWFYRQRVSKYRLLVLSRREPIPPDYTSENHADDMLQTVEALGWGPAVWECLSGGGPIGQCAAAKRPDLVRGLILTSSPYHAVGRVRSSLEGWLAMARELEGPERVWSMLEGKYRPPSDVLPAGEDPLKTLSAAPHYPNRLERILLEQLELDHRELLPRIACPVLVLAGEKDRVVPPQSQREMAALLPRGRFILSAGFGHFHDMDDPAYHDHVDQFMKEIEVQ